MPPGTRHSTLRIPYIDLHPSGPTQQTYPPLQQHPRSLRLLHVPTRPPHKPNNRLAINALRYTHANPDILPHAFLLLLRLRLSSDPHLNPWKNESLNEHIWFAAAIIALKFDDDNCNDVLKCWAGCLEIDVGRLVKAEYLLLMNSEWRGWAKDEVFEPWRNGLEGLWCEMERKGVLEVPGLCVARRRRRRISPAEAEMIHKLVWKLQSRELCELSFLTRRSGSRLGRVLHQKLYIGSVHDLASLAIGSMC